MKKKITAICLVVALAAIAVIGGTLAYFTDNDDQAVNTFTIGDVEIELTEPNWDSSGKEDAPEVYPGEALAKDPTVENTGSNPCFVRVKVTGLEQFENKGAIGLRYNYADGYNTTDWTLYDGFYYYNGVLASDGVTNPVFSQIVMPTSLDGSEEPEPIVVFAQAVQAQGAKPSFAAVQTMTVDEIAAWFTTCGMPDTSAAVAE